MVPRLAYVVGMVTGLARTSVERNTKMATIGKMVADALRGAMLETTVAGKVFTIDPAKLPDNALLDLLRYGTQRRFNDATGGSDKTTADKHEKVADMIAGYYEGVTSTRRVGGGVDELTKIMRQFAQALLKETQSKEVYKAKITDAEAADREKILDSVIARNPDAFAEKAEAELARRKAEATERAKLAAGLDLTI